MPDKMTLDVTEIESSGESYVLVLPRNVDAAEFREAWREAIENGPRILFVCGEGAAIVPARQVVGYVPFDLTLEQDDA